MLENVKQTETVKPVKVNLETHAESSTLGGVFVFIHW
jgi:hypothetical protein